MALTSAECHCCGMWLQSGGSSNHREWVLRSDVGKGKGGRRSEWGGMQPEGPFLAKPDRNIRIEKLREKERDLGSR